MAFALVAFLTAGCAARIAPYDPTLNDGLAGLQTKIAGFLEELEQRAGTPDAAWEKHAAFYESVRADLQDLRFRAAAHGGNELTLGSLDLVSDSIDDLEQLHRSGLNGTEIPILRSLFETQLRMLIQLETAKRRTGEAAS